MFDLKNLTSRELEEKILAFWDERRIFQKSVAQRKNRKSFSFYDGPPFANGLPHYGHILASVIKDTVTRFWTMAGYRVERRVGWDCHGLPVEYEIEKGLALKSKRDIERLGIKNFNHACRDSVFRYAKEWEATLKRAGRWADYSNAYATLDNSYIESVWWVFKNLWTQGLVYKEYRVSPYCPRCGTPLSNFEVNQGYRDAEDTAVYVKFKISESALRAQNSRSNAVKLPPETYFLAWTTTPWTLPGNVGLAVDPSIDYALVQERNAHFLIAKERTGILRQPARILTAIKGAALAGLRYEPLFDALAEQKNLANVERAFAVMPADFVSAKEGTGIVHTAVMYGEDDFTLGKKHRLPMRHTVDENGCFTKDVPQWAGKFAKDVELDIVRDLDKRGLLYKKEKILHTYPFCWRCDTPLLYYALESWYVNVSSFRSALVKNNKRINWVPAHVKEGRFGKWLKEARDWSISRNRFWGAPLPVWHCTQCHEYVVAGSLKELDALAPSSHNRYFVLRHGEADSNVLNIQSSFPETIDNHLTKKGLRQIDALLPVLRKKKIDFIVASDLLRAKETAERVSHALDLPIHYDARLREYDVGNSNGKPIEEFGRAFPGDLLKFAEKSEGGETLRDVERRMMEALEEFEKKYRGKTILIVSHGDPLWVLEGTAQGMNEKQIAVSRRRYINTGELRPLRLLHLPRNERGALDLHRPYIDDFEAYCPRCKERLSRIPEVFDCWFESGSMPYGQWHYPFENKKLVERTFPADFIAEGLDQTRGWFYTLHVLATALTRKNIGLGKNQPAFKNVVMNGLILSETGVKLSKRLRNYTEPELVFEKYGADALRLFLLSSTPIGEDYRFSDRGVAETKSKTVDRLLNCAHFLALYRRERHALMRAPQRAVKDVSLLDRWIFARLNETTAAMTRALKAYDLTTASRALVAFIDDLSNWYVRRSRRRLQRPESRPDYEAAVRTLTAVLRQGAILMAPFAPFAADALYKNSAPRHDAKQKESVHLEDWPVCRIARNDMLLIKKMRVVRDLASAVLAKRAEKNIKVRQPLQRLTLGNNALDMKRDEALLELLRDEINVKEIVYDKRIKNGFALDTRISRELREEGLFREFTRLVQGLRQKAGYKPRDTIALSIDTTGDLRRILLGHAERIKQETSAKTVHFARTEKFDAEEATIIDTHTLWVGVKK